MLQIETDYVMLQIETLVVEDSKLFDAATHAVQVAGRNRVFLLSNFWEKNIGIRLFYTGNP